MDEHSSEVYPLFPKPLMITKVIAPLQYKRSIIKAVEGFGQIEPIEVDPRTGVDEIRVEERRNLVESYRSQLNNFLDALDEDLINKKHEPIMIGSEEEDVLKFLRMVVEDRGDTISSLIKRKDAIKDRISDLRSIIDLLDKFDTLHIEDTEILVDSSRVKTFLGSIFRGSVNRLYWEIDEITDSRYMIIDEAMSKEDSVVLLTVLQEDAEAVETRLKTIQFSDIMIPKDSDLDGLTITDCLSEIETLEAETEEIDLQLENIARENGFEFVAALEVSDLELQRISVEQKMRRTASTCVMWAWLPDTIKDEFTTAMNAATEGSADVDFRKGDFDPASVPSQANNSEFMQPMRSLVTSFGTPGLKEVDPYPFVKYMFPILFGIMFADLGHGLLLAIAGYIFYRRKKKMAKLPEGLGAFIYGGAELMIIMGLTAAFFGILMNSVFGDETILWSIDPLRAVLEPTTWDFFFKFPYAEDPELAKKYPENFDYIERDYVSLLLFSFAVGAIVILLGLALNLYKLHKYRHSDAEIYAAYTLTGVYVFVIFAFVGSVITPILLYVFIVLTFGCLIATLVIEFRAHGIDGLMLGVDHILSLMSNTFSFGRLLAMNTIHFVLALLPYLFLSLIPRLDHVLNHHVGTMGNVDGWAENIAGDPLIFVFWFIAAFIGSLIVVPVETTFSTLQALRLNWVEFFGKFFKGTGIPFNPVRAIRQYTIEN